MEEAMRVNGIEYNIPISRKEIFRMYPKGSVIILYPPGKFEIKNDGLHINEKTIIAGSKRRRL